MSIYVTVHNKDGEWFEWERACFGFLSYISNWEDHEVADSSSSLESEDDEGIEGFSAENLKCVDYQVRPFAYIGGMDTDKARCWPLVQEAIKGLPQFYGNVELQGDLENHNKEATFIIPLENVCMQVPVLAGMMLRNVLQYTGSFQSFAKLTNMGVKPTTAFLLAQCFSYSQGFGNAGHFYRGGNGDECIFPQHARIGDVANILAGNLNDPWQGEFGDTANGYGRYGEYNGRDAERCPRTGHRKDLTHLMLLKESPDDTSWLKDEKFRSQLQSGMYPTSNEQMALIVEELEAETAKLLAVPETTEEVGEESVG